VIHALPAVARLKQAFPGAHLTWAIEPRWAPLLAGNPYVDDVMEVSTAVWRKQPFRPGTWSDAGGFLWGLGRSGHDLAFDFQGLIKSALLARLSGARVIGFARHELREPPARLFYSERVETKARHVVDKNLALAAALGAESGAVEFPLPQGKPQPDLPAGDFVLASPVGGWKSKQWPPQYYSRLAELLHRHSGSMLLLDCAPDDRLYCEQIRRLAPAGSCQLQVSNIEGLIAATRRARAVVGIDSGPLHLAAALGARGVAIFGQTDPARNGPYGDGFRVLRAPDALTSYKRVDDLAPSMATIGPEEVWQALEPLLA
jgi:lipopolysaccharide heptosyltransferase I